jgi:hypothetical protein
MRSNRTPGASGIKVEDLKRWHNQARPAYKFNSKENDPPYPIPESVEIWKKVLKIIILAFEDGKIPKSFCNTILVLIPKAFRGIALLEVIYKLISSIMNTRLQNAIEFDDAAHGFRPKQGTGTAIIEAKMLMQLHYRLDVPLFMIFIDLKKVYNTLDRVQAARILKKYEVGPNVIRYINLIWEGDTMVPRQTGDFGQQFRASRGV